MTETHEEILANFQSIAEIDDVAKAIFHLEESNWDLAVAIQRKDEVNYVPPEVPSEPGGDAMNDSGVERLKQIYTLNIITQRNDGTKRMCQLQFPGTQTILEIKTNVSSLTNIAVEQQVWTGWPPNVTDDKMLGVSDIPLESNLSLQAASASAETADAGKPLEPVDKFYDATDSGN